MIALDLDGTILDYSPETDRPRVNPVVVNFIFFIPGQTGAPAPRAA